MHPVPFKTWPALLGAAVLAVGVIAVHAAGERVGIRALREATSHRMDIYAASLQSEMNRYEYLPPVVSMQQDALALLRRPADAARRGAVNRYLQAVNEQTGAAAIYLLDGEGLTLASSNWNRADSFVNSRFAYRPYFQDAVKGKPGRFYGIGTVSRAPGYYFAHGIREGDTTIGVAAVKVNLDKLDQSWGHPGEKILVVDGNGVVILSSEPGWKFRALAPLSNETLGRLAATRQYTEAGSMKQLTLHQRRQLDEGAAIVQVMATSPGQAERDRGADYLVYGRPVPGTDWRLLVMSDMAAARSFAWNSAAVAALVLVLLGVVGLYVQQRRRSVAQALAAREALQQANDQLERKVLQRTDALSRSNRQLHTEIAERKRAEETLRATLEDLVQTAKMAVLGTMSAGITHELNQPLAALRTLSANAVVFLDRGQQEEAKSNLQVIAQLTDHMGKITAQLKKFARKSAVELRPVAVAGVIGDALFLLQQSTQPDPMRIVQRIEPAGVQALCEANRLEQVIVNLLSNAIDALRGTHDPCIELHVQAGDEWVCITVHDNGPGVPDDCLSRLFEPFFTTKEQGMGLGLGLAISAGIVRNFGGTLRYDTSPLLGGAAFTVQLKAVAATVTEHADA